MAGVSASHLIIFIASLVIAAGVVGTLTTGVDRVNSAIDDRSLDVSQQVRMDMAIVSDPANPSISGDELTIHVRNTGSQGVPIDPSVVDIIFNSEFIGNDRINMTNANPGGDTNVWNPGSVVEISVSGLTIDATNNRLLLIINEDEETFEFNN